MLCIITVVDSLYCVYEIRDRVITPRERYLTVLQGPAFITTKICALYFSMETFHSILKDVAIRIAHIRVSRAEFHRAQGMAVATVRRPPLDDIDQFIKGKYELVLASGCSIKGLIKSPRA